MIGLAIKSSRICEHVNNLVEHKSVMNENIKELQTAICCSDKEIEASRVVLDKLYADVDALKKSVVSNDDIEELVIDIRSSFELFVNNTPRHDDVKLKNLEERFNALNEKFEALGLGEEVEVEVIKKSSSRGIPKLNLVKKKNNNVI